MGGRSLKQVEKLIAIITFIIFVLIFFLKTPDLRLTQKAKSLFPVSSVEECTDWQNNSFSRKTIPVLSNAAGKLQPENKAELLAPVGVSTRKLQVCIQVFNKGKTAVNDIRLDVPLLGNLNSPYQTLLKESFNPQPLKIQELAYNNRMANFHITSLAPGTTETIVLDYFVKLTPLKTDLSFFIPAALFPAENYSEQIYLVPAKKIESNHPEIIAIAAKVTENLSNNLDKVQAVFKFVIKHMHYDLHSPNRNGGALAALRNGSGVCEDYAALFVALCRAQGVPARLVNGYTDAGKSGKGRQVAPGEVLSLAGCRHCWAEFYLEEWGWLPADPTLNTNADKLVYFASLPQASHLAQNYADQSLRARYQGGQLDVTWEEKFTTF